MFATLTVVSITVFQKIVSLLTMLLYVSNTSLIVINISILLVISKIALLLLR